MTADADLGVGRRTIEDHEDARFDEDPEPSVSTGGLLEVRRAHEVV